MIKPIIFVFALMALAVGVFTGMHYAQGGVGEQRFDMRVWERDGEVALSIRPEGGRWSDHGTHRVAMDGLSASGWRYGDASITVAVSAPPPVATPAPTTCNFAHGEQHARHAIARIRGSTAFHVGDGYFLTASHVVRGQIGFSIVGDNWDTSVRLVEHLGSDVALLRAPSAPTRFALSPADAVHEDEGVAVMGFPAYASSVVVTHTEITRNSYGTLSIGDDPGGGTSGAPILDQCGKVVALFHSFCEPDGLGCGSATVIINDDWRERIPPWR